MVVVLVVTAAASAIYYKRMKNWAENKLLSMNYDIEFSRRLVLLLSPFYKQGDD